MTAALEQDVIVYHIMKTAGTTVSRLLEEIYGADRVYIVPNHDEDPARFLRGAALSEPVVLMGHPHDKFEHWRSVHARGGRPLRMTFLRNPVERWLSCYYFLRRSRHIQRHVGRFELSVEEALLSGDARLCDNMMTKAVASLGEPRDYVAPADGADLAAAVENLGRLDVVGLSERFEVSYAMVCHALGVAPVPVKRWNVNPGNAGRGGLSAATLRAVTRHNLYDAELYLYAAKLFEARLAEIGSELKPILRRIEESPVRYMTRQD